MNAISFYEPDGRIVAHLTGDAVAIDATKENTQELWVDGYFDGKTHYIDDGEAITRPVSPTVLDGLTLKQLPVPCTIVINGTEYDCDEVVAELDLPMSTAYKIKVMAFPHLDAEFNIET
jgi:hypothetical protein